MWGCSFRVAIVRQDGHTDTHDCPCHSRGPKWLGSTYMLCTGLWPGHGGSSGMSHSSVLPLENKSRVGDGHFRRESHVNY